MLPIRRRTGVVAIVVVCLAAGVIARQWQRGAPAREAKRIMATLRARPSWPIQVDLSRELPADNGAPAVALPTAPHPARVTLPERSTEPLRVEDVTTGMAIDVQVRGAFNVVGQATDGYLVYANAHSSGGTLLHRIVEDGAEDFVSFEKRPAVPEVAYDLTLQKAVSGLRLVEGTLEMLDRDGTPRLRAAPPFIVGADGARTDATLAVEGCAVDTSPAAPWGRVVTPPGGENCILRVRWPDEKVEYPAVLDPRWQTTGSMSVARQDHIAILLSTGKVLVAGGRSTSTSTTGLASAELFDRTTNTWSGTGSMTTGGGRYQFTATQLATNSNSNTSAHILAAGGANAGGSLNTAQLYSVSTGSWASVTTNLPSPRSSHSATLLASGKVLLAGGMNGTTLLSPAVIYDPTSGTGTWTATTGPIPPPGVKNNTATLLTTSNGQLSNKVLLVGGNSGSSTIASVFLFDPTQSTFSTLSALSSPREGHTATALVNGNILITGGKNGSTTLATTQIFNPSTSMGSWSSAGNMTAARQGHSATLLPAGLVANGQVLVAGGSNGSASLGTAELWNGTTTWTATSALPAAVQGHTATLLANGAVLVAGGVNGSTTQSASLLYDASDGLGCTSNSQCTTGFCVSGVCCDSACTGQCSTCNLTGSVGICSPKANGTTCNDSNACTSGETCQGGSCTGGTTVTCSGADTCHTVGACVPATGCPAPVAKANGTTCNDSNACTSGETCQGGSCTGGTTVTCSGADTCHTVGACVPATGCPAPIAKANGTTCNDSNACTSGETCQGGSCTGGTTVTCSGADTCHTVGACVPATGCPAPIAKANGTTCNDSNACTSGETCQGGSCTGGTTVTCSGADTCHTVGACVPATGCPAPIAKANGTTCNDSNACTSGETCQGGSCTGGTTVTCSGADQCNTVGTCVPTTGCPTPVAKANGTTCDDGNACTAADACQSGACISGTPVTCVAQDDCHTKGFCDGTTGCADQTAQPDGTPCTGGVCMAAVCQPLSASSAVPTPLDPTVPIDIQHSTSFLYTGPNAIQIGVQTGTIVQNRAAVMRGKVLDASGSGIAGASVLVVGRPEYGVTVTGSDGVFSMAANGGEPLRLQYQAQGYLPVQRTSFVSDLDYSWFPEVTLTQLDPAKTTITLAGNPGIQAAMATPVTDSAGTRQSVLLFPPGTQATIEQSDGTSTPVNSLTIHSTEYTVGPQGPTAMPAALPHFSGYTYAVELSAEEATGGDVTRVAFSQPVVNYVDNFLNFPTGSVVPVAYHDPAGGGWIPSSSGVVLTVLSTSGGIATIDSDGDGVADTASELAALGVTAEELAAVASLYPPGHSLWRVPVTHFSSWDFNWPTIFPGARPPSPSVQSNNSNNPDTCPQTGGTTIDCMNQAMTETVGVVGTPYTLAYSSARVPGYALGARSIDIPVSGTSIDPSMQVIKLTVSVAGESSQQFFQPTPNLVAHFTWDGLDGFGREALGTNLATVVVDYLYSAPYLPPSATSPWDVPPPPPVIPIPGASFDRSTLGFEFHFGAPLLNASSKSQDGLGGWSLSNHHSYDPRTFKLTRGDGTVAAALPANLTPIGNPTATLSGADQLPAPDGSFYLSNEFHFGIGPNIVKVAPSGSYTIVAANVEPLYLAADGPTIVFSHQVQPFPNELSNVGVIERLNADGSISAVAGDSSPVDCATPPSGDDGPATDACIGFVNKIVVAPDRQIYFIDGFSLRKIDASGVLRNVLSSANTSAYELALFAITPDYSIYLTMVPLASANAPGTTHRVVKRLLGDGTLQSVAGMETGSESCSDTDGSGGIRSSTCDGLLLEVGPDGALYTLSRLTFPFQGSTVTRGAITKILPNGNVAEVFPGLVGVNILNLKLTPSGQFLVTAQIPAANPSAFEFWGSEGVYLLGPSTPGVGAGSVLHVPSADGTEIYEFDGSGRHQKTYDGLTSALKYQFGYDGAGYVNTIADGNGLVTSVVRDGSETPSAIVSPTGQTTSLAPDPNGYLASITSPGGSQYQFTYQSNGLMVQEVDPRSGVHTFTYDPILGRLTKDETPVGGGWSLAQSGSGSDSVVGMTSATGVTATTESNAPFGALATNGTVSTGRRTFTVTRPDGLSTTNQIDSQGDRTVTGPEGTTTTTTMAPDPRFGMAASYVATQTETTPGGLTNSVSTSRTASVASDGVTLVSQTEATNINGRTTTTTYDGGSRTTTITSPGGRQSVATQDDHGRTVLSQIGTLAPASYLYDSRGRLESITVGNGPGARVTSFSFDAFDRRNALTDSLSRTHGFGYDADNRITSQTTPSGVETVSSYDPAGDLIALTPPGESEHTFAYTLAGDQASYTAPIVSGVGSSTTLYSYNLDRQRTLITRPDERSVSLSYDSLGRLSTTAYDAATVTRNYSPTTGKVLSMVSSDGGSLDFDYDGSLLLSTTWSGIVHGTVSRTWNNDFRIATEAVTGGSTMNFSYDPDGLITAVGDMTVARDTATGLITGTVLGVTTDSRTYNAFAERTGYVASYGETTLFQTQDTLDDAGRTTGRTESLSGSPHTVNYSYDTAARLTGVTVDGAPFAAYTYDPNGNRLSRTTTNGTVVGTYDSQDRLQTYGNLSYTYNANGDVATRTDTTSGQVTAYSFDAIGNLRSVTLPDGRIIEYVIDGAGRRVGKKINGQLVKGWLYRNSLRPVAELDQNSQLVSQFVYATTGTVPSFMIAGGGTFRIIADSLGSVVAVVSTADGSIIEQVSRDEYGAVLSDSLPGYQPFGFAGGLYDADTGLVRFGVRDYDPTIGRWLTKDPARFVFGTNGYSYAEGDPVNGADPTGLARWDQWYGFNNRDFQNWVHRQMKDDGQADFSQDELKELYQDWLSQGKPGGDKRNKPRRGDQCEADSEPMSDPDSALDPGSNGDADPDDGPSNPPTHKFEGPGPWWETGEPVNPIPAVPGVMGPMVPSLPSIPPILIPALP